MPFQDLPACQARDRVTPGDRPWPGAGERSAAGLPGNLAAETTARGRTEPGDLCPDGRMARPPVADARICVNWGRLVLVYLRASMHVYPDRGDRHSSFSFISGRER